MKTKKMMAMLTALTLMAITAMARATVYQAEDCVVSKTHRGGARIDDGKFGLYKYPDKLCHGKTFLLHQKSPAVTEANVLHLRLTGLKPSTECSFVLTLSLNPKTRDSGLALDYSYVSAADAVSKDALTITDNDYLSVDQQMLDYKMANVTSSAAGVVDIYFGKQSGRVGAWRGIDQLTLAPPIKPMVEFPNFNISAGDATLIGTPTRKGYTFTLTNTGKTDIEAKIELPDAPNGYASLALPWRRGKDQEDILNTSGPGSKFTYAEKLTVPAGKSVSCRFPINCPNWNPYNRYPLTCRLTVGDQVSTQTREILGAKSKGILLGQARNSKDIKESSIGVGYAYYHGALKKCLPMVADAGIKWNRDSVRFSGSETVKTKSGEEVKLPTQITAEHVNYLEDMRKNGIKLIFCTGGGSKNPEAHYLIWKRKAELLKPYGVNHFEIFNEPNGHMPKKWGGNWNGVTDDMEIAPWIYKFVEFVNAGAKGIKEVHPDATVIAGAGLTSTAHRAIQVGLSKDVDGVTDHPYPYSVTPELVPWGGEHCLKRDGFVSADDDHTFLSQMRRLKEEAVKAGRPDLQIWLTEWGIPVFQYHGKTALTQKEMNKLSFNVIEMGAKRLFIYEGHTLNTQAKYLARRLIETLSIPDIVTKNFYFCFNRGPWFDKYHPEKGGFSLTRTQDATPRPSFYAMQRITGLFSDGVKPVKNLKIDVPLDRKQGRTGAAWKRPYGSNPALWEGVVPMNELTTPRKYAFSTPQGELMIAVWMPVRAEDWRQPDFCNITIGTTDYENPIAIDILTGERTDLEWSEKTKNGVTVLKNVTVPDSPIVIKMFPKK